MKKSSGRGEKGVVGGIFEQEQIFGMETKEIIIDIQNIIQTM